MNDTHRRVDAAVTAVADALRTTPTVSPQDIVYTVLRAYLAPSSLQTAPSLRDIFAARARQVGSRIPAGHRALLELETIRIQEEAVVSVLTHEAQALDAWKREPRRYEYHRPRT